MKLFMKKSSNDLKALGVQSELNSKLVSNKTWSKQLNDILEKDKL